jgi:hypothetical protein
VVLCQSLYPPVIPTTQEAEVGRPQFRTWPKLARPYLKNKLKAKRIRGVAQVVGYLSSKHEALSSTRNTGKKKKKDLWIFIKLSKRSDITKHVKTYIFIFYH